MILSPGAMFIATGAAFGELPVSFHDPNAGVSWSERGFKVPLFPDDGRHVTREDGPMGVPAPARPGEARPTRVLLVDDNPDLVNVAERVLKRNGMVVECAWDGITAADLVKRTEFDVVVSDVAMP